MRGTIVIATLLLAVTGMANACPSPVPKGLSCTLQDSVIEGPKLVSQTNEIVYFFMYRCPHCRLLHEELETWRRRLPENVGFVDVHLPGDALKSNPTAGRPAMPTFLGLHYMLAAAGVTDSSQVFELLRDGLSVGEALSSRALDDRLRAVDAPLLAKAAKLAGKPEAEFAKSINSFRVHAEERAGRARSAQFGAESATLFVVNRKYRVRVVELLTEPKDRRAALEWIGRLADS